MNDRKELHKKFVELGRARSKISHKLLSLLPEIYEDAKCLSIYEYATKFGDGLSYGVVDKVLKIKEVLRDCPKMFAQIEKKLGVQNHQQTLKRLLKAMNDQLFPEEKSGSRVWSFEGGDCGDEAGVGVGCCDGVVGGCVDENEEGDYLGHICDFPTEVFSIV